MRTDIGSPRELRNILTNAWSYSMMIIWQVHTHSNTCNTVLVLTRVLSSSWRQLPGTGLKHTNEALLVYEGIWGILGTIERGVLFINVLTIFFFFFFFFFKRELQIKICSKSISLCDYSLWLQTNITEHNTDDVSSHC